MYYQYDYRTVTLLKDSLLSIATCASATQTGIQLVTNALYTERHRIQHYGILNRNRLKQAVGDLLKNQAKLALKLKLLCIALVVMKICRWCSYSAIDADIVMIMEEGSFVSNLTFNLSKTSSSQPAI